MILFYDIPAARLTLTWSSSFPATVRKLIDLPEVQALVRPSKHVHRTRGQLKLEERVLLVSVCGNFKSAPDCITSLVQPSKNLRATAAAAFAEVALNWLSADPSQMSAVQAKLIEKESVSE